MLTVIFSMLVGVLMYLIYAVIAYCIVIMIQGIIATIKGWF